MNDAKKFEVALNLIECIEGKGAQDYHISTSDKEIIIEGLKALLHVLRPGAFQKFRNEV